MMSSSSLSSLVVSPPRALSSSREATSSSSSSSLSLSSSSSSHASSRGMGHGGTGGFPSSRHNSPDYDYNNRSPSTPPAPWSFKKRRATTTTQSGHDNNPFHGLVANESSDDDDGDSPYPRSPVRKVIRKDTSSYYFSPPSVGPSHHTTPFKLSSPSDVSSLPLRTVLPRSSGPGGEWSPPIRRTPSIEAACGLVSLQQQQQQQQRHNHNHLDPTPTDYLAVNRIEQLILERSGNVSLGDLSTRFQLDPQSFQHPIVNVMLATRYDDVATPFLYQVDPTTNRLKMTDQEFKEFCRRVWNKWLWAMKQPSRNLCQIISRSTLLNLRLPGEAFYREGYDHPYSFEKCRLLVPPLYRSTKLIEFPGDVPSSAYYPSPSPSPSLGTSTSSSSSSLVDLGQGQGPSSSSSMSSLSSTSPVLECSLTFEMQIGFGPWALYRPLTILIKDPQRGVTVREWMDRIYAFYEEPVTQGEFLTMAKNGAPVREDQWDKWVAARAAYLMNQDYYAPLRPLASAVNKDAGPLTDIIFAYLEGIPRFRMMEQSNTDKSITRLVLYPTPRYSKEKQKWFFEFREVKMANHRPTNLTTLM